MHASLLFVTSLFVLKRLEPLCNFVEVSYMTVELNTCSTNHVHHSTEVTCPWLPLGQSNLRLHQLKDLTRCQKRDLEWMK